MRWVCPRTIRGNRGDLASRYAILRFLADHGFVVTAVFASRPQHLPPGLQSKILPYGPVYNLWPGWRGLRALRCAEGVIWTGGLDLQDDSSLIKLIHTWAVFRFYRLLGLKIVLLLQGAGPLATGLGRWLARRVLNCVDLALARDDGSGRLLAQFMPPARLRRAADGIFLRGGFGDDSARRRRQPAAERRAVVGVNVRLWFHFSHSWIPYQLARNSYRRRAEAEMDRLLSSIAGTIAHLRARHDAKIVLISMYEPDVEPWENDDSLLDRLRSRFASDPEVSVCRQDLGMEELLVSFGSFDLMIGMRLHSALMAIRAGTPALHLAYTLKGYDIYSDLGLADWLVPVEEVMRDPAALAERAERLLLDSAAAGRAVQAAEAAIALNDQIVVEALRALERH